VNVVTCDEAALQEAGSKGNPVEVGDRGVTAISLSSSAPAATTTTAKPPGLPQDSLQR